MDIQFRTKRTRLPAIAAALSFAATLLFSSVAANAQDNSFQSSTTANGFSVEQNNNSLQTPRPQPDDRNTRTTSTLTADAFRVPRKVDPSAWQSPAIGTDAHPGDPLLREPDYKMISYTRTDNGTEERGFIPAGNNNGPVMKPPSSGPLPSPHDQPLPRGNMQTYTGQVQHASFDTASAAGYLEQGIEFEQAGQWGEALALYQKALKDFPESPQLIQHRSVARLNFDLDRRYSDTSFVRTINETNGQKALNVYAEVLLRIQSYYVDEPDWSQLAGFGLSSLEVALQSKDFKQQNIPRVEQEAIARAIDSTRQQLRNYPAKNRHDVYVIAGTAARILESEIGLPAQATVYEFVCGAISALDPYSAFMSSNQYNETMSQIEGNFVGLGVELRTHPDYLEIVSVISGGSASRGGIERGDRIIAVDNLSITETGSERAADMLRGSEGSFVKLAVDRGGVPKELELERRRVEIPSVDRVNIVDPKTGVGYIQLTNFQKTTARDFDAALWQLQRQGMQSLIVDVRGNPGGLLKAAVEVAHRFINNGVIVSTRGRNPLEDYIHKAEAAGTWRVPLVVLIDENSASASEIFAAAIRDHDAGKIVGQQSYGKGSVQGIFPLNVSGGGVRLTTARFYSPTGQPISQVGVKADYAVTESARPDDFGTRIESDAGLRIAVQVARKIIPGPANARLQSVMSGNR